MSAKDLLWKQFDSLVVRLKGRPEIQSICLDTNEKSVLYDFETEEAEPMNSLPVFIDFMVFSITIKEIYWHAVGMRVLLVKIPYSYANLEGETEPNQAKYYSVSPYASAEIRRGGYSLFVRQCIGECVAWIANTLKAPERVVERARAIHEELVSVAWAPARVAAWLEAGAVLEDL